MFAREVIMNLKTCVKATVLTIGLAGIVTAGIVNAEDITNPTTENPMATEATIKTRIRIVFYQVIAIRLLVLKVKNVLITKELQVRS